MMAAPLKDLVRRRPLPPQGGAALGGILLALVTGLVLVFFLAAFRASFSYLDFFPDLLILFVLWLSLRAELFLAAIGAFAYGFLVDGLSMAPTGVAPVGLILVVLAVRLLSRAMDFHSPLYLMALALFIFVLSNIVIYPLLLYISYGKLPFDAISRYFSRYCAQGALSALAAPPLFRALDVLTARGA
jgi:rod shape-determining protein MreD